MAGLNRNTGAQQADLKRISEQINMLTSSLESL